jgi:hypothetical protein
MSRRTEHQRHRALRDASRPAESRVALTVERGREIVAAIEAGNFQSIAAKAGGVSHDTLKRWLERGERGEEPYAKFVVAYREAEYLVESTAVGRLKDAGIEDWRATQIFLSRRFPERWSDSAEKLAVMGPGGAGLVDIGGIRITIHLSESDGYGPPHAVLNGSAKPVPALGDDRDDEDD